ncbi:MAG: hypothetical protein HOV71_30955 [Hamadaea sp.]|nr:hypothetical protein [Hamadaea sp.]NUR52566.1 hypothetical protein [Hamadaea sp.]NUT05130.1 hypothetical protein [Hamadaea sp.]
MRFHRSRTWYFEPLAFVAVVLAFVWLGLLLRRDVSSGLPAGLPVKIVVQEATALLVAAAGALILGLRLLVARRFRFVVDDQGLTIHTSRVVADFRWPAVESVVVDDFRVVVVLAGGGQPREVLALSEVSETTEEVADAFARYAGARFTDARARP